MRATDYRETERSVKVVSDGDDWRSHIRSAIARDLPEFQPALCGHDGTFVVVGSGPSLPEFVDEIRAERDKRRPICAVKGAHDFLCENGIEPDFFVSVEPRDRVSQVTKANDRTVYFLASRCDPKLFDALENRKRVLFHTYQGKDIHELAGRQVIGGGTTSGLRAVTLGYLMGFSKFVMYGFDSCIVNGVKRFTQEKPGLIVDRWVNGRRFLCNGALAMQADEVQEYMTLFPDITFDFKGDGLIAAIWAERRRLGKRT